MFDWIKNHITLLFIIIVVVGTGFLMQGCPPRVPSLIDDDTEVTRQELQLELDTIIQTAEFRMMDLDKQDQFRAIILQNALILVQGQPLNPIGILIGIAALYGVAQTASKVKTVVKETRVKRKENNG
ncbi:hypothetical protein LCGC14_0984120 [marine sediment metagenome]|uniref:Uncharacterized protein n=1 Tax=marine sediment metagenome TaxID=412755 RepID=A0A0F9N7P4_9ZZZZ